MVVIDVGIMGIDSSDVRYELHRFITVCITCFRTVGIFPIHVYKCV